MNAKLSRLQRSVSQIRAKFEEIKKLDGTSEDATPAGDGYVEIRDEYESKGHISFDKSGQPTSMRYSEWDDLDFDYEAETRSYYISKHEESGQMYYFSEVDSRNSEVWSPGPRVAVDPATGQVTGEFSTREVPHKFVPLTSK